LVYEARMACWSFASLLDVLLILSLAACAADPAPLVAPGAAPAAIADFGPLAEKAGVGVDAPALRALLAEHWDVEMRRWPTWATTLGDHRFDDRMREDDLAAVARYRAALRGVLGRARALDEQGLSARDRVTQALLVQTLTGTVGLEVCHEEEWAVPGQALAYKIGQLEILELRARAEKALGARFDLRAFHDAVLGGGAVTLPVLAREVDAFIEARKGTSP
jgi:uncharacterized protein (DUF885 family)